MAFVLDSLGGLGALGGSIIVLDLPPCPVDRAWKARLIHVLRVLAFLDTRLAGVTPPESVMRP